MTSGLLLGMIVFGLITGLSIGVGFYGKSKDKKRWDSLKEETKVCDIHKSKLVDRFVKNKGFNIVYVNDLDKCEIDDCKQPPTCMIKKTTNESKGIVPV